MRPFIITAAIIFVAAIFLISRVWNPVENGPDSVNPRPFLGCYSSGADRLILKTGSATVLDGGQSTIIERFLTLKSVAAIQTVNDLRLDASGNHLRIGSATSGFFYRFDSSSKPSALIIPDDDGTERILSRIAC